ncbi:hypothetical protein PV05_05686 [Exophiala xenobiotica]|uniref:Uncharacterized protein n=1 Tax=Exophiala xenobiotica TaxID=348802 RepID=A0A0D2EQR6_9EURO|nr:uncharacterized protein PV05_05686 [Exophiala xenobiotica]KIW57085.1 hypothetical protein PV05_05686 [Exophiala xenobiotica]
MGLAAELCAVITTSRAPKHSRSRTTIFLRVLRTSQGCFGIAKAHRKDKSGHQLSNMDPFSRSLKPPRAGEEDCLDDHTTLECDSSSNDKHQGFLGTDLFKLHAFSNFKFVW